LAEPEFFGLSIQSKRVAMKHLGFVLVGLAIALSACRGQGDESRESSLTETSTQSAPTKVTSTGQENGEGASIYEVWFVANEGFRFVSKRPAEPEPATARAAFESLLSGPSQDEAAASVFTAVPADTELLGLEIDDGIATVDLSSEYERGAGSATDLRLAQVVYTLTQFETVDAVTFRIDGEAVELFGDHGIMLGRPQRRTDYKMFLPANLAEDPAVLG
jgi:spore germination protein GerM